MHLYDWVFLILAWQHIEPFWKGFRTVVRHPPPPPPPFAPDWVT